MVEITKPYSFDCVHGKSVLLDLFEGRRQLILYHFMFAPDMPGWPTAVCEGCSWYVDNIGNLGHLHARDTSLVLVSRAPLPNILDYKKRMGWAVPWASSFESDFNHDFGVSGIQGERSGTSVFLRDGNRVYHTYSTSGRGDEALGSFWTFLDITPFGGRRAGRIHRPAGRNRNPTFGGVDTMNTSMTRQQERPAAISTGNGAAVRQCDCPAKRC
jgi:predicted dithiol-disulfide oxidoreductase (DUF899 family)